LEGVGEAHTRNLAQRGIGLLRRRGIDTRTNAALLRALRQRRHLVARSERPARLVDQLIDRRHLSSVPYKRNSRARAPYVAPPSRLKQNPRIGAPSFTAQSQLEA